MNPAIYPANPYSFHVEILYLKMIKTDTYQIISGFIPAVPSPTCVEDLLLPYMYP